MQALLKTALRPDSSNLIAPLVILLAIDPDASERLEPDSYSGVKVCLDFFLQAAMSSAEQAAELYVCAQSLKRYALREPYADRTQVRSRPRSPV